MSKSQRLYELRYNAGVVECSTEKRHSDLNSNSSKFLMTFYKLSVVTTVS